MSGPDKRSEARRQFDPHAPTREAREALERQQRVLQSLRETVGRTHDIIRHSKRLISRLSEKP